MLSRCTLGLSTLALVSAAVLVAAVAPQDKTVKAQPAAMSADETAMMEKWMAYATPGAEHKVLDAKVGKWTLKGQSWMAPGAPAEEFTGTADIKWILGNRYLEERVDSAMMGMPFQGVSIAGYDNLKKQYKWTWIDSMGTGFSTAEGSYDPAKKTFSYTTMMPDCMGGEYKKGRTVETTNGPDSWTMQMYSPDPTGKEFKCMELVYTRSKCRDPAARGEPRARTTAAGRDERVPAGRRASVGARARTDAGTEPPRARRGVDDGRRARSRVATPTIRACRNGRSARRSRPTAT